ncbi:MAG: asparagine--tRNA ligase [Flavobacteriales bacterium]|nr:asparagine--tRNA ligase [Flavobacteriales bacterium]
MLASPHTVESVLKTGKPGESLTLNGWVRTKRGSKAVSFIALNDGTCFDNLQVVADLEKFDEELLKKIATGACISVTGTLVESPGSGQAVEMQAENIALWGEADAETYPLQKKGHTLEFLREIAHLRPRTNTFGAIFRIRHHLAFAIHKFFNDRGFYYVNTPIITGSDAEGAGEMFRVSVLDAKNPPLNEDGSVNFEEDFFGAESNLTVSGQLQAEIAALALSKVYTFGPTFRAENSNTARHLAEFWMIEPEMAFYDLEDNMNLCESFLQFCVSHILGHCKSDLEFLQKMYEPTLLERIHFVINNPFKRITYTEAIDILENCGQKFEFPVAWGNDLQSEHERYLVEKHFNSPVIVTDYPKGIKAFYMRANDDGKTVRAMDILFPGIGEVVGGSQREERYSVLLERVKEQGIHEEDLWWYLELRKFGTAPHSGFGLGFERLMLFVTGMGNIRDVILAPRTPKNAKF